MLVKEKCNAGCRVAVEEAAGLGVLRQGLTEQRAVNAAREERLVAAEGIVARLKARATFFLGHVTPTDRTSALFAD